MNRLEDVKLGDVTMSKDLKTAKNQVAAFITKGAKTTYEALDKKEQAKTHIVMSLISQETAKASIMGAKIALDPNGRYEAFENFYNHVGGDAQDDKYRFTLAENGDLKVEFSSNYKVAILMAQVENGKTVSKKAGEGSKLESYTALTLRANELDRISELDFTKFDDTNASRIIQGSTTNKFDAIYNQFPKEFRLNYDNINCYTGFQATIK